MIFLTHVDSLNIFYKMYMSLLERIVRINILYIPTFSFLSIIVSNAVILFGTLFFRWSVENVLLIYWIESGIIGFFAVCGILFDPHRGCKTRFKWPEVIFGVSAKIISSVASRIGSIALFLIQFGGILLIQGFFVSAVIDGRFLGNLPFNSDFFQNHLKSILVACFGLTTSYGLSFWQNFVLQESRQLVVKNQFISQAYTRIMIIYLVLLLGILFSILSGTSQAFIVVLVSVKIILEVRMCRG